MKYRWLYSASYSADNMDILITGGAGFIGSHLAEQFASEGHSVVVMDNFDNFYNIDIKQHNIKKGRNAARGGEGDYELIKADVRNSKIVSNVVSKVDYVYHQAAQAGVRPSVKNPRKYHEINVEGTLNLLDACRDHGVDRFVLASSSSVYGVPQYLPYDEHHPTTPVSPYGASKLAAERYACSYSKVYDLPVVALRYFTVYGPRMRPNMAISNFVSRCVNDEPPIIYGDGTQTRDFTYIEDVVNANMALLNRSNADGQAINIGSEDNIKIKTLAQEICEQINPGLGLEYDGRHEADAEHTHSDISKASELIDYEPEHTIREGVGKFIQWYQNNRDWYEPLVRQS